jgi:hypothetical protein
MEHCRWRWSRLIVTILFVAQTGGAELIPVRHLEGVSFGFLVLSTLDGVPIAYGDLTQVVKAGNVMDDLKFHFKDGSFYQEITVFTQNKEFRLVRDQVIQKGPSFKEQIESWLDAATGKLTVQYLDKQKVEEKHLDLPTDVSNGLILTLLRNIDPSAPTTTFTMVAIPSGRLVKIHAVPEPEGFIQVGFLTNKTQHYRIHFEIEGVAGKVAPLVGKQPPDMHVWYVKSEAPAFVESEGPLYGGGPIWRIQQAVADSGDRKAKTK